ncbi:MAG: hypothetical protein ACRCTY_08015, partial [Candidatus Adiutrix sp.]
PLNSCLSTEKFTEVFGLTPPPWQYYVDRLLWRLSRQLPQTPKHHVIGNKYIHPGNERPR